MEAKHLWEVEHPYYCNESNFFKTGYALKSNSWIEFVDKDGYCDFDMNLLFRWDWVVHDNGDDVLMLFWILQRKGIFMSDEIKVSKADEKDIIEWLNKRFDHLFKLWEPIS